MGVDHADVRIMIASRPETVESRSGCGGNAAEDRCCRLGRIRSHPDLDNSVILSRCAGSGQPDKRERCDD